MGETGLSRFPGNLDPRAQEFRPTTLFRPPQVYYPYGAAPPPYASNDVQVVPFGGAGYAQYPAHPQVGVPIPPPFTGPTRTLALSYVVGDVSETIVRRDLEVFGEVRGVQMERLMEGIVIVHFYDLRHAETAFKEIREQYMQLQPQSYGLKNPCSSGFMLMNNNNNLSTGCCDSQVAGESLMIMSSYAPVLPLPARGLVAGRPVWAQFIVPPCNAVPDGNNQGTVVLFNLDSGVSSSTLKEIFQAFGPVKELRETPLKRHQRFIEFYDVRDAAKALNEMNGQEIYGKHVVIEFSRPGGHSKRFFYANANSTSCTSSLNYSTIYQKRNSDYKPPFSAHPPSYGPRSFIAETSPHLRKKSPSNSLKGNPNNVNVACSIEASVASLSLANAIQDININPGRRNSKKGQSYQSIVSLAKPQQVKNRSRQWKGKHAKKFDARFLISEDAAAVESNCKDSRTTVMIKNIPNKYSQKLLLNMLDNHCIHCNEQIAEGDDQPLSSYDFVYLPIDFNNKCNVGYGFVNMTSPEATWRLYKAFHLQNWEVFNSRKICEVTYARVQGLEALKEHFKNSKFPSEMDHYLPVVFSPPRDGRQLTEPLPIVGLGLDHSKQSMSAIGNIIGHSLTNPNVLTDLLDDHHHHDNLLDGSDTLDTANNSESDYADQTHLLIGGSCSSSSTNGGDVVDADDDRDSGSCSVPAASN